MAEETMPAAEAGVEARDEVSHYELAFHILPTVADGEVSSVFDEIKAFIAKHKGEAGEEEMPQRIPLAYDIKEMVEGKYQRFSEAYFGWIRFHLSPSELESLTAEVRGHNTILRYLIVKLDKREEEQPFRFFERKEAVKADEEPVIVSSKTESEETAEVSEEELDKSLEGITS